MAQRFENLVELFEQSCDKYAERPLFGTKRNGVWEWTSYRELHGLVDRFRGGLASLGVSKGDPIAIVSDNRLEWAVAAYATYGLEAAFVPMYPAQRPSEWQFILGDCEAKVVIAGSETIYEALIAMRPALPALRHVVGLERPASDPTSWAALLEAGAGMPVPARSPAPASIAGVIYTSGTTGKPKGVLLSHQNLTSNLSALHENFHFEPDDRSLSFLPWAHSYGQTEVNALLSMGASLAINDTLANLIPNLAEVKPTILVAVPRIFNRIYEGVNRDITSRPGFLQRIIRAGVRGAIKRKKGEKLSPMERVDLAFDERLVFAKIREKVGGRLKYAISASATLGRDVAEFIDAIGLTVYEGYGLTETSPIVSANLPGHRRFGSVGHVLPGVRVVIDTSVSADPTEGEIVVYGPNVMVGYHKRPEENAKALMPDGGLRTGDLGHLDEDGFLYITGRIKEQYKLENGKYVMPSPLEEELKLSPYIANVMIDGDGRPFNVALVAIDEGAIRAWAEETGVTLDEELERDLHLRALIREELAAHSVGFKEFEKPRGFALVREDFTTQNGLLTPTLKLKRAAVRARYRAYLDALYAAKEAPAPAPIPPAQ
jgi:long-chain acyl-CoA synthetase